MDQLRNMTHLKMYQRFGDGLVWCWYDLVMDGFGDGGVLLWWIYLVLVMLGYLLDGLGC